MAIVLDFITEGSCGSPVLAELDTGPAGSLGRGGFLLCVGYSGAEVVMGGGSGGGGGG